MECHPDNTHIDFFLKEISDLISQEFKSMRQGMKIEFAKVQENMEDMVSKILAETKKDETINNAIPIKKASQALDVESDMGICIKEVYSQDASVFPLVEAIKEEPLLLQHWEVSEMDDPSMSMSNKFSHQSEIGVNAVVKTVEPQTCIEEDHSEKASIYPQFDAIKEEPLLLQHWEDSETNDPSMSMSNKFSHQLEIGVNAVVQTVEPQTCIVEDHSRKTSVCPQFDIIEDKPLLLQKYAVSQTEIDDPNTSMLNKFLPQSNIGVNATIKIVKPQSCVARNSDEECNESVEMFLNKSTAIERTNACKVDAQLPVGNNKEKHFSCNFCDRSFKSTRNLNVHQRTHTGERPYQCDVCHKSFSQNGNLQAHMRTHTGERPFKCDVCDKSFSIKSNLNYHMRTHTGERPYICDVCHKSFSNSCNLKSHMRTHTGERPYQCDVCHKSFSISSSLKDHVRTHTGERPYQCQVCHKSFTQSNSLKNHIRIHTGEQPFQCQVCHKSFTQSSSLKHHMRIHNGE
ncbi:uncharacterized protein LOC143449189 isoform X1 [Clavelina lepadiformis]|uniref:uncharacterized protein LOC143449189 isoform X1 n=1 Tax=Clavelina lepadiformis TaxID=159417 RepID=UPI004041DA40